MRIVLILSMVLMMTGGCGVTASKPNSAQKWGTWAYVPGTSAYKARRAEGKEDKVDEAKKQLTRATEDLVTTANGEVRTNVSLASAVVIAKQNTQLHGLPDKPINTSLLLVTNVVDRDKAWRDLMLDFEKQQAELAYIRKVFETEKDKGLDVTKQDSSAETTVWKFKQWALMFFLRNWYLFILGGVAVWYGGKLAAKIYCPPVAMGMNVVEGFGNKAARAGFVQIVKAGERFKDGLEDIVANPELVAKIKEHFRVSQERTQDKATQDVIKTLTKPT